MVDTTRRLLFVAAALSAFLGLCAAPRPALAQIAEPPPVPSDLSMHTITRLSVERSALLTQHDALQMRLDMERQNCSRTLNTDQGMVGACDHAGGDIARQIADYRAAVASFRTELDAAEAAKSPLPPNSAPAPGAMPKPAP
jgi:hypothetical protein